MKKNILVFGLILGAILCTNTIIMMHRLVSNPNFEGNDVLGYAAMVVVFSLVYFGVRNYRNKQLDGIISFGKAFKIGALIVLVIAVGIGVALFFDPNDYKDQIAAAVGATAKAVENRVHRARQRLRTRLQGWA